MRSSILRQRQQVLQTCKTSTRRSFATSSSRNPNSLPSICQSCSKRPTHTTSQTPLRRRWQSSTASPHSATDTVSAHPVPPTYYELFPETLPQGPPPSGPFHIDVRELRREFLQLQAVAHPDRHPSHLKARAEGTSARINEAYKTLQNPLLRAQYLLSLKGIDVAEDETARVEDPELLMEVLDTREEIESAEEGDLDELRRMNEERIAASEKVLDRSFKEDDLDLAKAEAVRMRYWINIKESLDAWERGQPVVLVH
ncbi:HSC20 (HSCB), C-terminal oligomerization [Venustampulla echinocandica]|uniref:HSC20 (HSCB), C-terminal oligomerization n=1 Tax=Venustampulla echinocandica TaxID=2656787 RepID=A0A370TS56_9HELO|nr:HSC20 (HSCB), C-terminal oligomerization [Venustampulla echinocandica]RDL38318.1 HSC20 (HSCB), C-terminal oligomerization [Venustampulla echinocandica]